MTGKLLLAKGAVTVAAVGSLTFAAYGASRPTFAWRHVAIARAGRCLPVAYSEAAQERGLQGVSPVVRPMVFPYSPPATPSFWMKDTPTPLTGVWVGAGGRVIGYWHGTPESTDLHSPPAPVSAVVEYPAGARVPARGSLFAIGTGCRPRDRRL